MARTIAQIQSQITASYIASMAGIGITIDPTQWSKRNLQQLVIYIVATGIAIFEQIYDAYVTDIESAIAAASPQTGAWFQAQILRFQFNATTPQILQFDTVNFAPYYTSVNASYQVIKYCSVVPGTFGTTTIKVAARGTNGFPADLDTTYPGALAAVSSYVSLLAVGGITYNVTSGNADRLFMQLDVFYNGLYAAIIQASVIAAISAYLSGIPFNGVITISDMEAAIKAVPGVNDIVWGSVQSRAYATAVGSGTGLVTATYNADGSIATSTELQRKWGTNAGYIQPEDTTGANWQLTDYRSGSSGPKNLNLIPGNN